MQKNVADEKQIKDARLHERFAKRKEQEDIQFLLSTPQGRRYIWKVLSICGVYRQSAVDSGSWTYFNEGRRSVGLKLLDEVMIADAAAYLKMIDENKQDEIPKEEIVKKGNK